jgi:hypothetical protein
VNDENTTINTAAAQGIVDNRIYWFTGEFGDYSFASADPTVPEQSVSKPSWTGVGIPSNDKVWKGWPAALDPWGGYWLYAYRDATLLIDPTTPTKGALPPVPTAPSVQMPYTWSVKLRAESAGRLDAAKFAGIVAGAADGLDKYDVMDLPLMPGGTVRLSFIHEDGNYLQDMKAPADEMSWPFKVSSVSDTPVTIRFDASAVPSEYRTILLVDTETDAQINLRDATSYVYKPSGNIRNFKLIVSKVHPEAYAAIPDKPELLQNFPNPFNPETWIPYRLSKGSDVSIGIYNIAGQHVRTIFLGHKEAGSYTARERAAYWDGKNSLGEQVAGGVYFYHIQSGAVHATKKMVIVK